MKTRRSQLTGIAAIIALAGAQSRAQQPTNNPEADALMKRAQAFVEAFHNADAKALAGFWTLDGDYTDQLGNHLKGREAIQNAFAEMFAENQGLKLRIDIAHLRFVSPDVAVEDGSSAVMPPDGSPPSRARYTIVHVKKEGQWYLSSVRETVLPPPSNYQFLRPLEWMIGEWVDHEPAGETAHVNFNWTQNQNFILSSHVTTLKNVPVAAGTQWIGWDPAAGRIRSWTFDAEGGFSEGIWTIDKQKVTVRMTTTLRDGRKLTATNIITRLDADTVSWQSKERKLDADSLPDVPEIKMKRQK